MRPHVPQAGAIVFRTDGGSLQILLVQAEKDPSQWIFPKGHLDEGESHAAAALRETSEEAGVSGILIGLVGPASTFQSGDERVRVEYYLVQMVTETTSPEGREKKWVPPATALDDLAFEDARQLLRTALPELERRLHASGSERFQEFLLHEYDHLGESLLANEDSGEKRVTFFITLCGTVGAGLGFLLQNQTFALPQILLVDLALVVLFVLGYATLLRVVVRNATSDRYKNQLSRIRQHFLTGPDDSRLRVLPFHPYEMIRRKTGKSSSGSVDAHRRDSRRWRLGKGGWLETIALVETLLAGVFVAFSVWMGGIPQSDQWKAAVALVGGVACAVLMWHLLLGQCNAIYDAELAKGRDGSEPLSGGGGPFPT